MESPAFPLPGSSKSAQTYSFSTEPASLTGGSHPPSHFLASLAYQRFKGKGEFTATPIILKIVPE